MGEYSLVGTRKIGTDYLAGVRTLSGTSIPLEYLHYNHSSHKSKDIRVADIYK